MNTNDCLNCDNHVLEKIDGIDYSYCKLHKSIISTLVFWNRIDTNECYEPIQMSFF